MPNHEALCRDCASFIAAKKRCVVHGPSDVIEPYGWCENITETRRPSGATNKIRSGYHEKMKPGGFGKAKPRGL